MNPITKYFTLLFFLFSCYSSVIAQSDSNKYEKPYTIAAGLKIGNLFQLDYKHFINSEIALNFSSGFSLINSGGLFNSIIINYHHDTHIENLFWYYGGGLAGKFTFGVLSEREKIGMATNIGFEVVSNDKLFNFFVDVQPTAYSKSRFSAFGGLSSFARNIELEYLIAATVGLRYIFK